MKEAAFSTKLSSFLMDDCKKIRRTFALENVINDIA
jgi:hypothetical protein